jgi:SAM-dependent methyltransferase
MDTRTSLRTIFDQVALDYDEVRPGYPAELIEDVISISGIPKDGRILEVGCGTGQATIPFAKRGYSMTCLDIGKELADLAAQKCRQYPKVHIQTVSFEDWEPEENAFDLFISATAFHWIPPEVGYPKAAKILKDSGYIAIFSNLHPTSYTGFFQAVQKVYQEVVPEWKKPGNGPSTEEGIRTTEAYINETGLFEPVLVKGYLWTKDYNTEEYLKLLNTYSDHRNLEESRRTRLFRGIGELIEKEYGGTITRPYLAVLYIARKR